MATKTHVKPKSSWKKVDFDLDLFSQGDLDGFVALEELTEYEIINEGSSEKNSENLSKNRSPEAPHDKNNVGKKKKKGRQKQKKVAANTIHDGNSSQGKCGKKGLAGSKERKRDGKVLKAAGKDIIDVSATALVEQAQNLENLDAEKTGEKRKIKGTEVETSPVKKKKRDVNSVIQDNPKLQPDPKRKKKDMSAWKDLFVPPTVLQALEDKGFVSPTPIQVQVLPSAIRDRLDVVGAAQTGSGKTLAFGIPVLHYILQEKERERREAALSEYKNTDDGGMKDSIKRDSSDEEGSDDTGDMEFEDSDIEEELEEEEEEEGEEEEDQSDSDSGYDVVEKTENASSDEGQEMNDTGIGCVKVVKDVEFDWLKTAPQEADGLTRRHPLALILEPTRELAIQVKNHLQAAAKHTDITIAVIVGGLAPQKQQRILKKQPDIIVATPGRLWELLQDGERYLSRMEDTRYMVVDEADRMVEKGHFEELSSLLEKMNVDPKKRAKRHTYVFSATLTMIHSGPQRLLKKKRAQKRNEKQKLELLIERIGLKEKPKVVDLTRKLGTVETLTEAKINCTLEDKDVYMYYFLKRYPGRTLIFTNSKDCIRRLVSIFSLLQCSPLPLHADMHQRQRLKNLERFTANPKGLLLASDVAARGLDIPNVQHVIHYQVPRTVENYVHRSGRTARAFKEGLSVMIVGPDDVKNYRKIITTLNRNEDLPIFPVEQEILSALRSRVNLVRKIETQEYRFQKTKRQNDWFTKAAEEMDIEIEDEHLLNDIGDKVEQTKHKQYIRQMKDELETMLKQPVLPRGFSSKYPTKSGHLTTLSADEGDRDAIEHVKKDRKVQDKLLADNPLKPRPEKPKKKKWKKKKKNKS